MAATITPKTVSYEEWLRLPVPEGGVEEVVDGAIIHTPPNHWTHTVTTENLADLLRAGLDSKTWRVVTANFGLVIRTAPLTCRTPDIAVLDRLRSVVRDGLVHSAPELIVEVLSPSEHRAEVRRKLSDYAALQSPEVWLVSPQAQSIEVFLLRDGNLVSDRIVTEGELRPSRLPGVTVDIRFVWPE